MKKRAFIIIINVLLFFLSATIALSYEVVISDQVTSYSLWTIESGLWVGDSHYEQIMPAGEPPLGSFASIIRTYPEILDDKIGVIFDVKPTTDTASMVEELYGIGLWRNTKSSDIFSAPFFGLRSTPGKEIGDIKTVSVWDGTKWLSEEGYNWTFNKWYRFEIRFRKDLIFPNKIRFDLFVWELENEYRPQKLLMKNVGIDMKLLPQIESTISLITYSSNGTINGGGSAWFDNIVIFYGAPETQICLPHISTIDEVPSINEPIFYGTIPIQVLETSMPPGVIGVSNCIVRIFSEGAKQPLAAFEDSEGASIFEFGKVPPEPLPYATFTDNGFTTVWEVPDDLPQGNYNIEATLSDLYATSTSSTITRKIYVNPLPPIPNLIYPENLTCLDYENPVIEIICNDPTAISFEVETASKPEMYNKCVPVLDQLSEEIKNLYGESGCVPTAIASCLMYWGNFSEKYSIFNPGADNLHFKTAVDLIKAIGTALKTVKDQGTLFENKFSLIQQFLEHYAPGKFVTKVILNGKHPNIKKYLKPGREKDDNIVDRYRKELEANREDVIVQYHWGYFDEEKDKYVTGGHAVTGNSVKNGKNEDGTQSIDFMDPWNEENPEYNPDSDGYWIDGDVENIIHSLLVISEKNPEDTAGFTKATNGEISTSPGPLLIYIPKDKLKENSWNFIKVKITNNQGQAMEDIFTFWMPANPTPPPNIVVDSSMEWGEIRVCNEYPKELTISNDGESTLTITKIDIEGSDFKIDPRIFPIEVPTSDSIKINVIAHAHSPDGGETTGTLLIYSNDPDSTTTLVSLYAYGITPDISVSPLILDFNEVLTGDKSQKDVTIENIGSDYLTIMNIILSGDGFTLVNPIVFPKIIQKGDKITLGIEFNPITEGDYSGTLDIESDDIDEPLVSVSLIGKGKCQTTWDFDFSTSAPLGWIYSGPIPGMSVPNPLVGDNYIGIQSTDNQSNFAFWMSPTDIINVLPDSLYRATFSISTNVENPTEVPQMRIRSNHITFMQADYVVIDSQSDAAFSPGQTPKDYFLYFTPPNYTKDPSLNYISLCFDLLNINPDDDAAGEIYLHQATVYRIPLSELGIVDDVYYQDFEENYDGWASLGVLGSPDFEWTSGTLRIISHNNENTFGFWGTWSDLITFEAGKLYKIKYTVKTSVREPTMVPAVRLRCNSEGFQSASVRVIDSFADGSMSPTVEGKDYLVFYYPPQSGVGTPYDKFGLSFDMLNITPGDDPNGDLMLDKIEINTVIPLPIEP